MKSEKHNEFNFVKSGINKTIGQINETIRHVNKSIQSGELESNNKISTCADKHDFFLVCMILTTMKRLQAHL